MNTFVRHLGALVAIFVLTYGAGFIGSLFTTPNIPTWYESLKFPPLIPPNGVFGIVWNILYFLIAVSAYLVWRIPSDRDKRTAATWFSLQLILNTMWSIVFFGLQQPWLGLAVIILLIASIVKTLLVFRRHSRFASYLMIPYLLWVLFATYLNVGIALLN